MYSYTNKVGNIETVVIKFVPNDFKISVYFLKYSRL